MAVDSALMASASHREFGVWRTYAWSHPTVSFGRHEATRNRFSPESLAVTGLDAVRRPTGGRALLHDAEVTYSVTLPIGDRTPWKAIYASVNRILLAALRSLGVNAELVPVSGTSTLRPDGPLCFEQPSPGEIVVEGAKISGSAAWRERGAYLQHGSILLHDGQHRLHPAMVAGAMTTGMPRAASLAGSLAETPSWDAVASALENALRGAVADRHSPGDIVTTDEASLTDSALIASQEARFRDVTWLWRR